MESPDECWDPKKFRAREKELLIQELLRSGQKLSGGSEYLIFKQIFGSAKFDCGIRNAAGPAEKIAGSGKGSGHMKLFELKKKRLPTLKMLICLKKLHADLDIRVIS